MPFGRSLLYRLKDGLSQSFIDVNIYCARYMILLLSESKYDDIYESVARFIDDS